MPIDYERMKRVFPKQKAALTRAMKITDPIKRLDAVKATCKKTVQEWDEIGAWPDAWSRWQRTLDDVILQARHAGFDQMLVGVITLEDLE